MHAHTDNTMKVDKAVCTNDALDDLSRAIKFEAIFSTLVENKILAIKHECERKKKTTKRPAFGATLLGKRIFGTGKKKNEHDVEKGDIKLSTIIKKTEYDDIKDDAAAPADLEDDGDEHNKNPESHHHVHDLQHHKIENETIEIADDEDTTKSRRPRRRQSPTDLRKNEDDINIEENVLFENEIQKTQQLLTQGCYNSNGTTTQHVCDNNDSLSTELNHTNSTNENIIKKPNNSELKSSLTDNSQNNDTISNISLSAQHDNSTDNDSYHKSITNKSFYLQESSASCIAEADNFAAYSAKDASIYFETDLARLRVLEAKSISAQCSPVFPRQKSVIGDTSKQHKKSGHETTHQKLLNRELVKQASIAAESDTKRTKDKSSKSGHKIIAQPSCIEYDSIISYNSNASSPTGIISSFNQLTSTFPVITTTKSKNSYCDTVKLQKLGGTAAAANSAALTTRAKECSKRKCKNKECRREEENPLKICNDESDSEMNRRKRKKYRRAHRYSDPVLVYPSSSGLQHCILSRPPNQPLHLQYDEDFVFDVSLQLETDRRDLEGIVSKRKRHKNRQQRHGKRKRHKTKVLIHDIDNQSVKVIDPDDLPQRARWTIIATAFLLLIMCLLLVGVTLRMAPIIDDMVRQENERLMQEMTRGKFGRNFTETVQLAPSEEIS